MSTLSVSTITTPDEFTELIIRTANNLGPSLVMSSANDKIFLNGTLDGLDFPEVRDAVNTAYAAADTANASDDIAIAGFAQANTARSHANVSFAQANTARDHANVSFAQANTARDYANVSFAQANTARDYANVSFTQANTARDEANTKTSTGKAIAMAIVFG